AVFQISHQHARLLVGAEGITKRPVRYRLRVILSNQRPRHAERLEHPPGEKRVKGLAAHARHDLREQKVTAGAVRIMRAGRKIERALMAEKPEDLAAGDDVLLVQPLEEEEQVIITNPARMVKEMFEGDAFAEIRQLRDVLSHIVIERDFSVGNEQEHGGGRELLGE